MKDLCGVKGVEWEVVGDFHYILGRTTPPHSYCLWGF